VAASTAVNAPTMTVPADKRQASKPRRHSSEQPFDRLSRSVASLWRRFF
jgi:hypothetical protein